MGAHFETISETEINEQKRIMKLIGEHPNVPKRYCVVTYGCQMNAHDSEKITGMLREMGMTESPSREEADFVIFNTCCVRDNAERRALGNVTWLKEVRKNHPNMIIAVCGCMVQQPGMAEKLMKQYRFVNLAFGTANLHRFPELLLETLDSMAPVIKVETRDVIAEKLPVCRARKESAYITVMYGCDNFCSYCIVPYVRGRERSRSVKSILEEAEILRDNGVKEIMLLGQNVNSFGKGSADGITFAGLLRKLDSIGIQRIRFMTSHPKDLSDELIDVIAGSQHVLPQFHLPVQSGNNEILERMNRHYTRERYAERVNALRSAVPGIGLSTDIIVGFPGETEDQFMDTMHLVDEIGFDSAFTFVFSPRTGTKAAGMDGMISDEISGERIKRLIELQERKQRETLKRFIGSAENVLVENISKRSDKAVSGKGEHAVSVTLDGDRTDIGQIIRCRITELKNNTLMGVRI